VSSESLVLLTRANLEHVRLLPFAGGSAALYSRAAPGTARDNQDGAALIPLGAGRGLLAVADGAGGHAAGAEAAAAVLEALAEVAAGVVDPETTLRALILDAIERANERVLALASGAATTLAVVELDTGTIRPYHVGDSEVLVTGQRGAVRLQIVPHSPTGYAVEAGLLDAGEAIGHADRHLVSNVVGSADMRIEVGSALALQARDSVLLASDGLFDNLRQEEIVETVRKGSLRRAAQSLVERISARMEGGDLPSKPDDVTFLLWRPRAGRPS
jgi:serine/threonine protein phosphatase PrpC